MHTQSICCMKEAIMNSSVAATCQAVLRVDVPERNSVEAEKKE